MSKPNNPKCNTCFVVNNILRCWQCKYKTFENGVIQLKGEDK